MKVYGRLLLLTLIQPLAAWAVDLQPNDIVAPLPGKNHAMISYINTDNTTYYRNGSVVSAKPYGSPDVSAQTAIVRVSTTYSLKGLPAVSFIQMPYGSIKPAGSLAIYPTATGIGDLTLASAFWPYSDRVNRRYFGVAGYLTMPTGSYNSQQLFNTGENRYRSDIQMGYQQPVVGNLDGMVAVDTMWFGGNSQCAAACGLTTTTSLNQKPLTTTQLGPIYKINQTYTVGASYFYVAGGATTIGNTYQNNVVNTQRYFDKCLSVLPIWQSQSAIWT